MADEAAHRAEARANRDLAEHLLASRPDDPVYLRWAVTTTFYAGLHAITAYLVHDQATFLGMTRWGSWGQS